MRILRRRSEVFREWSLIDQSLVNYYGFAMMSGDVPLNEISWRELAKKILVVAVAGAGLVLVFEPDHTADIPILSAFALWLTHILFAAVIFVAALWTLQTAGLRGLLSTVMAVLLVPFFFAPASLLLDYGFGKPDEELLSSDGPLAIYLSELASVAPVAIAVAVVIAIVLSRQVPEGRRVAGESAPPLGQLLKSVPASLGDDIIRLHAQDHYVEVVTVKGRALLTEQFGDCLEKLAPLEGLQCHRSHWIALSHVENVSRSGSAYCCTMSNGDEVPVSRRRHGELKQRLGNA